MLELSVSNKRRIAIGCCILFALLIWIQHSYVFMYFDDYGYASLSYGWTENSHGMDFSLKDILSYLKWHYMNWGGRILYFFFEIVVFKIGGLKLMQQVQALIIILIGCVAGKIVSQITGADKSQCMALSLGLYGTFNLLTVNDAVYWYSASVIYVWPLLPLFGAIYYFLRWERNTKIAKVFSLFLFFSAAFSQEQIAVLTVIFVILYSILRYFETKHISKHSIAILISVLSGATLTILAPGNFVRASEQDRYIDFYSKSLLRRAIENVGKICNVNFGGYNFIFVIILTAFVGSLLAIYFKNNKIAIVSILFIAYFLLEYFIEVPLYFDIALRCVWFLFLSVALTIYYYQNNNILMSSLLYAGICSQGMMIVSPTVPVRCHIMMEFVLHIILIETIIRLWNISRNRIIGLSIALLLSYSLCNMVGIILGYQTNYQINEMNHLKLVEASLAYEEGHESEEVVLYKLRNDLFANKMPYYEDYRYIEYWMKNYYELPQTTTFHWLDVKGNI